MGEIRPGPLTASAADELTAAIEQTEANRRDIEKWAEDIPWEFPAKVTGYDQATGRCSWTLQTYNSVGRRIDSPLNVTGSFTYMPAYPVGNGVMPPLDPDGSGSGSPFPIEVWMRHRIATAILGPVFEFDWQCACDGGYSGSGGV